MVKTIDLIVRVIDQFSQPLKKADMALKNFAMSTKSVDRATGAMTVQFRGFRMEMLSVMFFGMALQSVFMGFINEILKNLGVFDMLSATMGELLYPILIPLSDILFQIMEVFMNLPDPIKAFLGALIIGITVGGTILFLIGTLTLAMGGLGIAFGSVLLPILVVVGAITAIIAILSWLESETGIVSSTIEGLSYVFSAAWNVMSQVAGIAWDIIKGIFIAILEFIAGIISGLTGTEMDWKDVWNAIVGALKWAWGMIGPIFKWISDGIAWIRENLGPILDMIGGGARAIGQFIGGSIKGVSGALGFGDFVWRPGSPPVSFSKDDTLIGVKGGGENLFSNSININVEKISSDYDIRELGGRLSDIQKMELSSRSLA